MLLWERKNLDAPEELAVAHPLPLRVAAFLLSTFFLLAMTLMTAAQAQAAPKQVPLGAPIEVSGDLETAPGVQPTELGEEFVGGTFDGFLKNAKVSVEGDEALLSGRLQGVATAPTGETQKINQKFEGVPMQVSNQSANAQQIQQQQQECQILFLNIQPIFLDLLGLQVSLSEITLDITAVSGPGNLLGNLLCGLVGILDPQ